MMTGNITPTSGEARICGFSMHHERFKGYKNIGFCPQFGGIELERSPESTLVEYNQLFGKERNIEAARYKTAKVIAEFGMERFAQKRAKNLSGGTKRKLSAAIALTCGERKVIFLDEPTTGVDASTRRFIWDRIKARSDGRAMILTTHSMDEADALCDRIGIMTRGKLSVIGSPQHLKSRHGGGYRVDLAGHDDDAHEIRALVTKLMPGARPLESQGGMQSYEAGKGNRVAELFKALEQAKKRGLLQSYSLSQTTLEQVFLNAATAKRNAIVGVKAPQEM